VTAPVEIKVYEPDGATLIGGGPVPRRDEVQWQDENNGVGSAQMSLHLDDAFLTAHPSLLDAFNIVKVRPVTATDPVYAWQLEELRPVRVSADESAGRKVTLTGRQVRSILETAQLLGSGEHRTFDFSSPDLPGYPGDWDTPVGVAQDSDPTARGGSPAGWPNGAANWLWSTDPTLSAPAERNWFRGEFTLVGDTDVTIWAAADNSMSLRLNGEVIATTDPTDLFGWRKMIEPYRATLPAGTHTVAAWVDNAASTALNPGGFLCTVGTTDAQGNLDTVLTETNTTGWYVRPASDPPGWRAAEILITALTEAQTAGDLSSAVTWDFDETLDSDGNTWDDLRDVQIPVGEDLLTLSNRWAGTVYDIHMTPDLVLQAWKRRGSDLSATVTLTPGVDVTSAAPTAGYGQIRNVVRFLYDGTWHEVTDAASVTAHGRRLTVLSFGDAGSLDEATQLATEALDDLADPQITQPVGSTSATGAQPFDDYNLGDTISAPGLLTGQADARVMGITGVEQDNRIDWTTDTYPET
jgi:hypothetical protein